MIAEAVARLWPGGVAQVETLGGGLTNHNARVVTPEGVVVLRVGGRDTELLGIDRRHEYEASVAAAGLGIAPEVVEFVESEGWLVTRFVEGEVGGVTPEEAAVMLRRLHDGPAIPGRFDAFRVVEAYAAVARSRGVDPPSAYDDALAVARRIEAALGPRPLRPCHNDLLPANFVRGADRVWLVDWEYAGMGDPAFDLANLAVNHELDEAAEARLLATYGADPGPHALMRFMSDFREAMWGVVQLAVSELDVDFEAYAGRHFERLERTSCEARFRTALGDG